MKNAIIFATLFATAIAAQAASIQVEGGRTYPGTDKNVGRVAVSETALGFTGQLAYDRTLNEGFRNDAVSATVSKDIFSLGNAKLNVFGGGQFGRTGSKEGFGVVYGVGVGYPIYKNVDAIIDIRQTRSQSRVEALDGNTVAAGVSVKF